LWRNGGNVNIHKRVFAKWNTMYKVIPIKVPWEKFTILILYKVQAEIIFTFNTLFYLSDTFKNLSYLPVFVVSKPIRHEKHPYYLLKDEFLNNLFYSSFSFFSSTTHFKSRKYQHISNIITEVYNRLNWILSFCVFSATLMNLTSLIKLLVPSWNDEVYIVSGWTPHHHPNNNM